MQADKSRVKDYINRLDNFDGPAVGEIAVGYEMFEEAFEIYKKFGLKTQAIRVLLDHQGDLNRAFEYAGKVCTTASSPFGWLHRCLITSKACRKQIQSAHISNVQKQARTWCIKVVHRLLTSNNHLQV